MTATPEALKASIDSSVAVAQAATVAALASAERVTALNLSAARDVFDHSFESAKAILQVRTVDDAASLHSAIVVPATEKATAYGKALYEIASEAQQELTKLAEAHFAEYQQAVNSLVEKAALSAPAGSEFAISALRSAVEKASEAYGQLNSATKQVVAVAQESVAAVTKAASAIKTK